MSHLVVLLSLVVALAGSVVALSIPGKSVRKIDWSLVRPISEFPHVQQITKNILGDSASEKFASNQRIVGGQVASAGQIPYQAAILADIDDGSGLCGGVLISSNYVLTAAVCVNGASEGTVILGAQNLQNENEVGQLRLDFTGSDVKIHEEYVEFIFRHNIAIVRLPQSVPITDRIRPAVLPAGSDSRTFAGLQGTVSGFGRTSDASTSFSEVLRYVSNPILTNADCNAGWYGDLIDGQKLCLSYSNTRGPCVGDNGGPLTVQDAGQSLLVGVFSFGSVIGCESLWPSVYVRVTFYLNWIAANTDVVIRSN
ncbi:brachyurin-like [Armigeres subalbatus]|uniref:brachyurin-like n=1 Tax=Armigeres subalbatus TaxID=124917 RepID=UPI002ED2BF1F